MLILTAAPLAAHDSRRVLQPYRLQSVEAESAGEEEREVTPSQLDKYVSVYRAMHKDRSLTVEQAAKNAGFSLAQFRDLESRVERNDPLRERARRALRPQNTAETPDTEGD